MHTYVYKSMRLSWNLMKYICFVFNNLTLHMKLCLAVCICSYFYKKKKAIQYTESFMLSNKKCAFTMQFIRRCAMHYIELTYRLLISVKDSVIVNCWCFYCCEDSSWKGSNFWTVCFYKNKNKSWKVRLIYYMISWLVQCLRQSFKTFRWNRQTNRTTTVTLRCTYTPKIKYNVRLHENA